MPALSKTDEIIALASTGLIRARDLDRLEIPRAYLKRLVTRKQLQKAGRGLYMASDAPLTELHSLAEVSKRAPNATVCLLSALQVHQLTTEVPGAVWLLIATHTRPPKIESPNIEIVRASGPALTTGTEVRDIEGVSVRITTPAKTVADCFRYRRHVGLEVAIAALRDYLSKSRRGRSKPKMSPVEELIIAAKADRVLRFMTPYLEALS